MFSKLDISFLDDWDQDLQKEAKDLIAEFGHLLELDDPDLAKSEAYFSTDQPDLIQKGIEGFLLANVGSWGDQKVQKSLV